MDGPWTTRKLLGWTTRHFEAKGIDSPRVAAEMLLGHVLNVPRLKLYMEPDRPADDAERRRFRDLVGRASRHEPVDYLIGHAPFFSMQFRVTPAVLIPRPSTETIVEHVLQRERTLNASKPADSIRRPLRLADVCTGSGAIVLALLKHLPHATAVATDLSEEALAVARQNAADLGLADRVEFRQGDLYAPLGEERFDYLLSNPPYISDAEWADVLPNVKEYEPPHALRSGRDGLDHLRPLIARASHHLLPQTSGGTSGDVSGGEGGSQALFEIAASQAGAVTQLAQASRGLTNPKILKDHERRPRVLVVDATEPEARTR